jgi:hypothetical protein
VPLQTNIEYGFVGIDFAIQDEPVIGFCLIDVLLLPVGVKLF